MKNQWIILLFILFSLPLPAQSVRTQELEKQKKTLLNEIENTNKLLNENKRTINNVLNRLSLVTQQINSRKQLMEILEKEIKNLDEEIQLKELQVNDLKKKLHLKKENYAVSIQKMYKQKNNQEQLLFILSANHITQSFRRMLYLREYANWRKKQASEIIAQQNKITVEKETLEKNKKEKEMLANVRKNEEEQLHREEIVRKSEVAGLQKDRKKLQAIIEKKKKQADVLNRELEKIIAEEIVSAQIIVKSQPNKGKKAEVAAGFAMTKEEQTLSANFANNKGKLPFPLKGNYKIVEHFGIHQYRNLKNVQFNSNGIKIKTTAGNTAKAVFDGTVSRVFVVPGYQTSVIIRHGNYLTLYSSLEQVYVKRGNSVKTGQDIGKIYTDTEDNSTILYFELREGQKKLNPELWLYK
ncbi:MAG: peptidoglycan DD-metalloendopeptidase family protein [Dysgonamonadaceae bacterium]|jgi:septal ring factor EnvC (AmiA/AmiB activator)|nr:peptidoglycan DD-metalloendopeptidase family protein [Dysgonamonadaceae bacterium]